MKKAILISLALLAALAAAPADAEHKSFQVPVIAAGAEANMIYIWLTPDGRSYVIDSVVELEVGASACTNPIGNPNELVCEAPRIGGFRVNAAGGDDEVTLAKDVAIPVTLNGGAGNDVLAGGAGNDLLVGGNDDDRVVGRAGEDVIYGAAGNDTLLGGPHADTLRGGPGTDTLGGGPGADKARQYKGLPAAEE
jgi:hypothetical protein